MSPPAAWTAGEVVRAGPFSVSGEQVDAYVALTGQLYPVHTDDRFAQTVRMAGRIVPGLLVQAVAAARLQEALGPRGRLEPVAETVDFVAPIIVGMPWTVELSVLEARAGDVVALRRKILSADGKTLAIARLEARVAG